MRLIDADALTKRHCEGCKEYVIEGCKTDPVCASLIWVVEEPTIDPKSLRPNGRWKLEANGKPTCSECGRYSLYLLADYTRCNYCPNCGAKMEV